MLDRICFTSQYPGEGSQINLNSEETLPIHQTLRWAWYHLNLGTYIKSSLDFGQRPRRTATPKVEFLQGPYLYSISKNFEKSFQLDLESPQLKISPGVARALGPGVVSSSLIFTDKRKEKMFVSESDNQMLSWKKNLKHSFILLSMSLLSEQAQMSQI